MVEHRSIAREKVQAARKHSQGAIALVIIAYIPGSLLVKRKQQRGQSDLYPLIPSINFPNQ
ncbi:hypothetical protein D082_12160 [Synechocystis sp. PCC 6714]|nr:hypothetical protein D082_12160 [Synechocystis sp. PCC 6714]